MLTSFEPCLHRLVLRNPVQRTGKYAVSLEEYSEKIYPNFCAGPGQVWTRKSAEKIYQSGIRTPLFSLEDVFLTGIVRTKESIPLYKIEILK